MKYLITFLLSLCSTIGLSQLVSEPEGFSNFEKSFHRYYENIEPENRSTLLKTYRFNELPDIMDSLENSGYRLRFVHAVQSNVDSYYEREVTDSLQPTPFLDSNTFKLFSTFNRTCTDGIYSAHSIGDKYYIFYATIPTGMVNEVKYFFIKEE